MQPWNTSTARSHWAWLTCDGAGKAYSVNFQDLLDASFIANAARTDSRLLIFFPQPDDKRVMEVLVAIAVMPACIGLALLFQIGTLKIILWALQPRNENEPARGEVRELYSTHEIHGAL